MEQYEQKLRKIRQKFYFLNYFCNIMKIQKKNINRTPPVSSGKEKNYSTQQLRAQPAAGLVWSGVISRWEPAASIRAEPVRHSRHRQFLHTSSFLWMWKTTEIWDISSVQFSCSVMSDSLRPSGLQHTRLPCSSLTPGTYPNSCPLSQWCHPTNLSSVVPFSCLQSFPASGSFPMS